MSAEDMGDLGPFGPLIVAILVIVVLVLTQPIESDLAGIPMNLVAITVVGVGGALGTLEAIQQ